MRHFKPMLIACCLVGLAGPAVLAAPAPAKAKPAKAKAFDAGAFYGNSCAACHGQKGEGGVGPALGKVEAKGDAFIHARVRQGSPKGMPAFDKLSEEEVKALVTYVKRF